MTDTTTQKRKKVAFRLYALPTTAEATAKVEGYRFSRIAPGYTLVYTQKRKKPEGSILLTEADADRLTDADKRWLLDCNLTIYAEEIIKERPKEIAQFFDLLEQAIIQDLNGEGDAAHVAGDATDD